MRKNKFLFSCMLILIMCWAVAYHATPTHAGVVCEETVYNSNLVRAIQNKLQDAKIRNVRVDGKWGKGIEKALSEYQTARKLPVSGTMDRETFQMMFKDRPYEPISTLVQNPHGAPDDLYRQLCRN